MQILHRVGHSYSPQITAELGLLGIAWKRSGPIIVFVIAESDERWPLVRKWISERGAFESVTTEFTQAELLNADWLKMLPDWHHGYPQPQEGDFGYQEATYDLSSYCEDCGAGMIQARPFQMKGEPKWGRRTILQLNWVFDEFFVMPSLWDSVFKPVGIGCREVLDRRGMPLNTVVQLSFDHEVELDLSGYEPSICGSCGRPKYPPHVRGLFPSPLTEPTNAVVRSSQIFGSGASAQRAVFVSKSLFKALEKVRGASFWPVERISA
jgi:hypothetical protein